MKKMNFIAALLLGGLMCIGNAGCSEEDNVIGGNGNGNGGGNQPDEEILAVGMKADKLVKRISVYVNQTNDLMNTLSFDWAGKNIKCVTLSQCMGEKGNELETVAKWDYKYHGREVVCEVTCRNMETGVMEPRYAGGNPLIELDNEGYAKGYTLEYTEKREVHNDKGETKEVPVKLLITYNVERDASHRVVKDIRTIQETFAEEDLKWQGLDEQPRRETMWEGNFPVDEKGDLIGYFDNTVSKYENKNGFFPGMHSYMNVQQGIRHDLPMGPYDFFQIVTPKHLPNNLSIEHYKYEFDAEGYVTRVDDLREAFGEMYCNYYSVFEY